MATRPESRAVQEVPLSDLPFYWPLDPLPTASTVLNETPVSNPLVNSLRLQPSFLGRGLFKDAFCIFGWRLIVELQSESTYYPIIYVEGLGKTAMIADVATWIRTERGTALRNGCAVQRFVGSFSQ
jgi:hypothetical protein